MLWVRAPGNVAIDPLPLSAHDAAHLTGLGGAELIVVTHSDRLRAAAARAAPTGARVAGPRAERGRPGLDCTLWLGEGDEPVPGLRVLELEGSKTPGELALLLEETTLVTGDLVRAHAGGRLDLLPEPKLRDRGAALVSLRRLASLSRVEAVLPGDGWPAFRDGGALLRELLDSLGG